MMRAALTVFSLVLFAASARAQPTLTGDWDLTIVSPQGANTVKMTLTQTGEKVSGLFKSQMGELPFEGTLTGADLKFAFAIPVQGQSLDITLTGKVEGDTIAGKAQFGGFGEGDWNAKRAPAADAAKAEPAAAATATAATTTATGSAAAAIGQWDVTIKTPGGDFPATATLKDEEGKLAGTIASQMGEVPVTGTIEGKTLKLAFEAVTPQGNLPVTMTGDVDGDTIANGKAEITGMGTMEWTAKKKQP